MMNLKFGKTTFESKEALLLHLQEETKKANEAIREAKNWILENKKAFDCINLKVYDAAFYKWEEDFPNLTEEEANQVFDQFCEEEWEHFSFFLQEENIDWGKLVKYIGRTSSFYLHDRGIIEEPDHLFKEVPFMEEVLLNIVESEYTNDSFLKEYLTKEGEVLWEDPSEEKRTLKKDLLDFLEEEDEYSIEEILLELLYVKEKFCQDLKQSFSDTIRVYKEISEFKEKQVEIFKGYLQGASEEKETEEEKERTLMELKKEMEELYNEKYKSRIDSIMEEFLFEVPHTEGFAKVVKIEFSVEED